MGWDAYALGPNGGKIRDPQIRREFTKVGEWVKARTGTRDFALTGKICGLDVSTCGEMLHRASGRHHYDENTWHPAQMKFNWEFEINEGETDEAWAYWSARKFIEVCQKYNLTIKFSW